MEHEAPALFLALQQSGFAAAIRQSTWLYPLANIGHIVALVCFAGAIAVMDLRLVGVLSATSPAAVVDRARRFAIAAFAAQALTGFMLFAAEAGHVVLNPVFLTKLALIAAGLINIAIYEFGAKHAVQGLPPGVAMPRRARIAGFVSMAIWIAVAACGRLIAYV